ncbi:hypothetical protein PRIC2_000424 [Phytophthora ramorum]
MVSSLLDELPCLINEADELMARLSHLMTLFKTSRKSDATTCVDAASTDQDLATDVSREDFKQSLSPRHSLSLSGRNRSTEELRQTLEGIDMDAIVKFFARQFLTMQSMSFEKMNANLPTEDFERSALHTTSASVYQLMKRLHHWQQAAWESLTRFFADDNSSEAGVLTFDSHPQLTRLVLATVAKYVKMNLLWTSFSVIPGLLSLHSFLHHLQTLGDSRTGTGTPPAMFSPLEHTDHHVREFVLHFGSAPLLAIQHDFQLQVAGNGASLAALALSCFERYEACHDLAKLRLQGVFDLESLVSGAYASHSCLPDLLNNAEVEDWVISVVLCVPHQLQSAETNGSSSRGSLPVSPTSTNSPPCLQLWDFMQVIARNRLVLTLHRSHVVNLHELLYQQVTSSLSTAALTTGTSTSSSLSSFGSSRASMPLKKSMSALGKYALRNSGVNHRQRREVAVWLLQNCEQLMRHNPGLVAPSFPLLLSALAIARDEIEWVMCHGVRTGSLSNAGGYKAPLLPGHIKAKHLQRVLSSFCGAERELASLLTHSHRLRGLIEQHSHFLAEYYQMFLVNGDAEGIAYTIQELFTENESRSELPPLLEGFLDRERYRVSISSSPRVTWVREWRQANAHLATRTQLPLLQVLRARMECAVRHTQYACESPQLVEHAANFSKCWWFRDVVFERCVDQVLVPAPASSIGLLEVLSSLAEGRYILDELVDTEEAAQQAVRMTRQMDQMRASLVNQVELGLEAVVKRDVALQRDEISVSPEEKSEQVENKVTASNRKLSNFSRVQSSQVQRPSNAEVRLASPTSSVSRHNDSNIYAATIRKQAQIDDEEHYVELVRALLDHIELHGGGNVKSAIAHRVRACFVRFVRGVVVFSSSALTAGKVDNVVLRCSLKDAIEEIQCFLRATQRLLGGCCYGSTDNDKSELSLGETLQVTLSKILTAECSSLASILPQDKRLLDWTVDPPRVAEKELQQWSLVDRVAWLFVSLVTRRCHPSPSTSMSSPSILASVRKNCFVLAPGISEELDPRDFTNHEALCHLVGLIGSTGVESVSSTVANLLVAQILRLRSSIEAEHAVLAFMDMALSGNTSADVILATAQVRALDDIATQLIQIGTAAFLLQLLHVHSPNATKDAWEARVAPRVLYELQQDPDRRATWTRLLPVACSSAFHSGVWKRTTYLSSVEATDTNAHMMGLAMARLLPAPHSSPSLHRCAVAALRRASTCTTVLPCTTRSKLPLQLDASSADATTVRPLLEALELLVTTATSVGGGETAGAHGSALGELDLALERLLPRALLVLHSAA